MIYGNITHTKSVFDCTSGEKILVYGMWKSKATDTNFYVNLKFDIILIQLDA